jgi:hypothetical protein
MAETLQRHSQQWGERSQAIEWIRFENFESTPRTIERHREKLMHLMHADQLQELRRTLQTTPADQKSHVLMAAIIKARDAMGIVGLRIYDRFNE